MKNDQLDFDAFVEAVRGVELEGNLVHEAAHSAAVSTRTWRQVTEDQPAPDGVVS